MIITPERFKVLTPLGSMATVDEIASIFRLPIAPFTSPLCIRKNTDPEFQGAGRTLIVGYDQQGFTDDARIIRNIPLELLCKHLAVFGKSGYGKSTFIINLLIQLFAYGIPFLVIESAKKEYRVLKNFKNHEDEYLRKLANALEIYTIGAEGVSPLRFNPMLYPKGIGLFEHIEKIMSCIEASIPVSCGSLPALLFEAFDEVYERSAGSKDNLIIADVVSEVQKVFSTKDYSSQTKADMQTVIEVRLGGLARSIIGQVFQCREGIDINRLMNVPTIVELDVLPTKNLCALALFFLNAFCESLKTSTTKSKGLRRVIIIEEAHNILGSLGSKIVSDDTADPQSAAADVVSKLLLELRDLGVGIVLCDQHPSNIHTAALKSVASMLTFRQTHGDDRNELEKSMLFGPIEAQEIARLKPGEAHFFTERYYGPRKIRTENLHTKYNLKNRPSDSQLRSLIAEETWFKQARKSRIETELTQLSEALDKYETYRKKLSIRFKHLLGVYLSQLDRPDSTSRRKQFRTVFFQIKRLRAELLSRYREFIRGPWRRFRYLQSDFSDQHSDVQKLGSRVFKQFYDASRPLTQLLAEKMDKYLRQISIIYSKEV